MNPAKGLLLIDPARDPLGVLASTAPVVAAARHVRIRGDAVERVAGELRDVEAPAWDEAPHWRDGTWRTAVWVLVLDALNFCFWSADPDPARRWRVTWRGTEHNGYDALAAALHRAVAEGRPLWDAAYLADVSDDEVSDILHPVKGAPSIPLFPARVAHLREVGRGLLALGEDAARAGVTPVEYLIGEAGGSAARLVELVVRHFPSFDDTVLWPERSPLSDTDTVPAENIRFYKRAQILVADLHGAFAGSGLGAFHNLDGLTAFADYKVPQVLRRLGVLDYAPALASRIARRELIPAGSRPEVEIRAATVWACELLRRAMSTHGRAIATYELDWLLWTAGQALPPSSEPYHRTPTIFY